MEKPTVLVTFPMSREIVARLSSDSRIGKLQRVPRELAPLFRDLCTGPAGDPGDLGPCFAEADIIVCWQLPPGCVAWAPRLKWVQVWAAGIEGLKGSGVAETGIPVTNMAGVHAIPIAEHVLMTMLMLARSATTFFQEAQQRRWRREVLAKEVYGSTVGVVGLGGIGGRIADICRGVGMRVLATRRTATARQSNAQGVDELLPPGEIPYLLAQSDFVVVSCPLTPETRGLIGERELWAMKSTAYLINISRGEVVDEPALKRALREGWIAGAGLDVFGKEPLERESELWEMPNVIVTPHVSFASPRAEERAVAVFEDNLERFLSGKPLVNVVDPSLGY